MSAPTVHVSPTRYVVSCLPLENPRHRYFAVRVEWCGGDRWCVTDGSSCVGLDRKWSYESIPSDREDEWKARYRFDFGTAMKLAREVAPTLTCNGVTVKEALAREVADSTQEETK